ncbi:helix-turn-helix transcriptional regulator [Thermomonospora umbrina]|uniref:Putative DNA-binding transcriptional regulator YafY n=1 Tax=Thermomonospora umbrina TaxID=111806 RepID=A0A3D9SVM1_9ACTN|nr:YafY family protein [Thermomonospora umbrina]REE98550.1 putative DNA-binding transcriptional regulator YafY [Thermomonospora umbrina]
MLETSARLLRLLSLLQTPRDWPGRELAERLDVTTRTVRNDIERLRTLGYPVNSTRGVAGGYRLEAGTAMPPLLLDDEEAMAVALCLRAGTGHAVAGIEESALRALAKLEQVLPSRLRTRVNTLTSYTVPVPADRRAPVVEPEVLMTITAACRNHERLRFDYRGHDGTASVRVVEPYRLVSWGRRWYLVAWDVEREDWRTFRADRIAPRTPTGPRFPPRDLPEDVTTRIQRGVSAASWRYHAEVTVHAPAEVVAERISPAVGTVEDLGEGSCLLRTGAADLESLAVRLGMLGVDFTVTDPPELVEHLRVLAVRYGNATPSAG